jgi:sugar (pentulose or hexulose) kinase
MIRKISLTLIFVVLSGCSSTFNTSHVMLGEARTPTTASEIKIYTTPPAKYTEIAIVAGTNSGSLTISEQAKTDYVIGNLKEQAAKLGANGIILQQFSDQAVNVPIATYNGTQITTTSTTGFLKKGSGIAIFVERQK